MIQILKVTGESLSPFFLEGDFVVVSKIPFVLRRIKAGDIVVFRHPVYGTMIKKVEKISPDGEEIFRVGNSSREHRQPPVWSTATPAVDRQSDLAYP